MPGIQRKEHKRVNDIPGLVEAAEICKVDGTYVRICISFESYAIK